VLSVAASIVAGLVGIVIGGLLARRNARRDHADQLLAEALSDLVGAIGDHEAQRRYASAVSRIVLHGSPELIAAFEAFQRDATTKTEDGRRRLIAALQSARRELGRDRVDERAAGVLLFGPGSPRH
jgi:hypothetical protein